MSNSDSTESRWQRIAAKHLVGRKIDLVRYLDPQEAESLGWPSRPILVQLDDGTIFWPSQDDEGNDAGALFGQRGDGDDWVLPVLR